MYSRPGIYKAYSIIVFILAICSFVTSLIIATGAAMLQQFIPSAETADGVTLYTVVSIICAILSLFFAYVEFTSMFTFAQMIQHEQSGSKEPFRRMKIVLPPKFYKVFGSILFFVPLIISLVAMVVAVIVYSSSLGAFLAIPVIPIIITIIGLILLYVTYYCRYRTFGDLLEIKSTEKDKVNPNTVNSLAENKPNALRAYCSFLYILGVLILIGAIISLFFIAGPVASAAGGWAAFGACVGVLIYAAVIFMIFAVVGCYYDNLAKMLEHYMIEYKLL